MTRASPQAQQDPSAAGRSTQVNRRAERSRRTVLDTALGLLEESGVGGFRVDEVARRSGVAKTTIYRHWRTREALVLDACAKLGDEQTVPDTGDLSGDLHAYLTTIAELLQTANWSAVVPSIVDTAERDADFAAVHGEIQRGHAAPVLAIVQRAVARGELPADADPATIAAVLLGPLFYRRWFSREPLDAAFIGTVVQHAIAGL